VPLELAPNLSLATQVNPSFTPNAGLVPQSTTSPVPWSHSKYLSPPEKTTTGVPLEATPSTLPAASRSVDAPTDSVTK